MADPEILLLDEPAAGLDLTGREELLEALTELAADPRSPVLVLVTHHVEEIPRGFTHGLILGGGRVVAAGPLAQVVTAANLTLAYGIPVELTESSGRWTARKGAIIR
jgi:iron complex transport system ATP-binding protein